MKFKPGDRVKLKKDPEWVSRLCTIEGLYGVIRISDVFSMYGDIVCQVVWYNIDTHKEELTQFFYERYLEFDLKYHRRKKLEQVLEIE